MDGGGGGNEAEARETLLQMHAALRGAVPELRQIEQLLRASLELNHDSEVAPLLQQRIQQCAASIALLSAPLMPTAGREQEELRTMLSIKAFVEESVATLRDHKGLLEVLTCPMANQQPTLGTSERLWQEHGVRMERTAPMLQRGSEPAAAAPGGPATTWGQQQQQQQQPVPLGLALLQEQLPPPQLAGAEAAGGPILDFPVGQSIDMLPLLSSIGVGMGTVGGATGIPSLSQLIEGSFMSLSLKDDGPWGVAAAAAAAAVANNSGAAAAGQQPLPGDLVPMYQQQPGASTAAVQQQQQQQQQQPMELPSMQVLQAFLQPDATKQQVPAPHGGLPAVAPITVPQPTAVQHMQQQPAPPRQAAGQPLSVAAPGQSAAGQLASAQLQAASLMAAPAMHSVPASTSSPLSSDGPQGSSGSGSLPYRHVSFASLHLPPHAGGVKSTCSSLGEVHTHSSQMPAAAACLPYMLRPPLVAATAPLFAQRPPAAAVAAGGPAAPPPSRVAVVQAGNAVRIAPSTAQQVQPADADPAAYQRVTAATAQGPVAFVSVHEAPSHEFSQGETSLSKLFYSVKQTGMLPAPTVKEEEGEDGETGEGQDGGDDTSTYHTGRSRAGSAPSLDSSSPETSAPQVDEQMPAIKPEPKEPPPEVVGGTKRRRALVRLK